MKTAQIVYILAASAPFLAALILMAFFNFSSGKALVISYLCLFGAFSMEDGHCRRRFRKPVRRTEGP